MHYEYYICPKCKDKFIEKVRTGNEGPEDYKDGYCPTCGNRLVRACRGEKRMDNTIYKVSLEIPIELDRKTVKEFERILGKSGDFDIAAIMKKIEAEDEYIFEGDLFHTYRLIEALSECVYTVTPEIPYQIFMDMLVSLCPRCGGETVVRDEEMENERIQSGWFCENCNEWVMYTTLDKKQLDETIYHLEFPPLGEIDCEAKEFVIDTINGLEDREELEDKIIVNAKATDIYYILKGLEAADIMYKIEPPFPYEIKKFAKFEDILDRICALNPGLDKEALRGDLELKRGRLQAKGEDI